MSIESPARTILSWAARSEGAHGDLDLAHRDGPRRAAGELRLRERKLLVEFIGSFLLVLTVTLATAPTGAGALAPLAIGSVLVALVFAGAHISGAHYNPAVTIALLAARKMRSGETASYIATQLIAAVVAAWLARALVGPQAAAVVGDTWMILVVETLFSGALAYVVLNVAVSASTEGNSYFGLATGLTVTAGALAVGGISGGAFNPAVALGQCVTGAFAWDRLWAYVLAGVAGGCIAAMTAVFLLFDGEDVRGR
jgi:aquaporin Z